MGKGMLVFQLSLFMGLSSSFMMNTIPQQSRRVERMAIQNDIALAVASGAFAVEVVALGFAVSKYIENRQIDAEVKSALAEAEVQVAERARIIALQAAERKAVAERKRLEREQIEQRIAAAREEEIRVQRNQEIALQREAEKKKLQAAALAASAPASSA